MANMAFCIYCDSLDVTETFVAGYDEPDRYEYYCHDCGEVWADDESEFEAGV